MSEIKEFFKEEALDTIKKIEAVKNKGDFVFGVITDSHSSDNEENTFENIRYVDEKVNFNCLVHLGDMICGNIPKNASRLLLNNSISGYRNATKSKKLYISQGNHDGYRDETYTGQSVTCIALDEIWYEDTKFMDENKNLCRPGIKPYYYVDFPEYKIRFIVLCSNAYNIDTEKKIFDKIYGMHDEQIEWLGETLMSTPSDYVTFVFTHINPFTLGKNNPNTKEQTPKYVAKTTSNFPNVTALLKAFKEGKSVIVNNKNYDFTSNKGTVAAWLFGHSHDDVYVKWENINCVEVASQTAYIPQLWKPLGEFPSPRDMNTANEDAWDAIVVNRAERKLYFTRFGAGKDRIIEY